MEWTDESIVLGVRRHGEVNAILEVVTRAHGRHLGLVRGGAGSRLRPVLQPGNSVRVVWRARLDEHLGNFAVEGLRLRAAAFLPAAHAVYGVTHLAALCRLLPERDPHPAIYGTLEAILDRMGDCDAVAARVVRFELMLLTELGFGLDLKTCAACPPSCGRKNPPRLLRRNSPTRSRSPASSWPATCSNRALWHCPLRARDSSPQSCAPVRAHARLR